MMQERARPCGGAAHAQHRSGCAWTGRSQWLSGSCTAYSSVVFAWLSEQVELRQAWGYLEEPVRLQAREIRPVIHRSLPGYWFSAKRAIGWWCRHHTTPMPTLQRPSFFYLNARLRAGRFAALPVRLARPHAQLKRARAGAGSAMLDNRRNHAASKSGWWTGGRGWTGPWFLFLLFRPARPCRHA